MRKRMPAGVVLAGLVAACGVVRPGRETPVPEVAGARETAMLKECRGVCEGMIGTAGVTFERGTAGWRTREVRLFYEARKDPINIDPDLARLSRLTSLESISLAGTYGTYTCGATDAGMRALAPLKHLRKLSLHRHSGNVDVAALAALPELEELDLSASSTDEQIQRDLVHLKDLPKLRKLNLSGRQLTDSSLEFLAGLKGLEVLSLDYDSGVTDAGLAKLKGLENLRELHLELVNVTDAGFAALGGFKKLEVLRIYAYLPGSPDLNRIGGAGLADLKALANLRELMLGSIEFSAKDLAVLKELPRLENLTIFGHVSDAGSKLDLSGLRSLKQANVHLDVGAAEIEFPPGLERIEFSIEQTRWASYSPSLGRLGHVAIKTHLQNGTQVFKQLRTLPNPVEFETMLVGDDKTRAFALAAPKTVRALRVVVCPARPFTDGSLVALAGLQELECLDIDNGEFGAGVASLAGLKNLRQLKLTGVSAKAFGAVGGLKELRSLALSGGWALRKTPPELDEALAGWEELAKLEELTLGGGRLTDAGLGHLARLRQLRTLNVAACKGYTDEGLGALMAALPGLKTTEGGYGPLGWVRRPE